MNNHSTAELTTGAQTDTELTVSGVRRVFPGGIVALERIDLRVHRGEFLAILGPSGCGKSTLLRMIAGLDHPTEGTITGVDPAHIAYVFQDAHLLPWRNVLRNVALPLELRGVSKQQRLIAARRAVEQVGLAEAIFRFPAQLSGGMRMRVSLAHALVTEPRLLLLDEPFASLDEITRAQLNVQLRTLWQARRMTVIFVTHSITDATFLAERAVVMSRRPGRVVIDHRINLPEERTNLIRVEPEFARQSRMLLDALVSGGVAVE